MFCVYERMKKKDERTSEGEEEERRRGRREMAMGIEMVV